MCFGAEKEIPEKVFGISLGQPLTAARCPKGKVGIALPTTFLCLMPDPIAEPWGAKLNAVCFPDSMRPDFVGSCLVAHVVGNRVESVGFDIPSMRDQDRALTELRKKYGEPVRLNQSTVQSKLGARFLVYEAEWIFPEFKVEFDGSLTAENIVLGSDRTTVTVFTDRYEKLRETWLAHKKAAEPKF